MKTKKLVALVLVAVLAITSVVGGTLAYFTDDEKAKNTMVVGNVEINIDEWKYEEGWKDFENDKFVLYPIENEQGINLFNKSVRTYNTSPSEDDAYIRSFVLIEKNDLLTEEHVNEGGADCCFPGIHFAYDNNPAAPYTSSKDGRQHYASKPAGSLDETVTVDGNEYWVAWYVEAQERAIPYDAALSSLHSVYMDKNITQEQVAGWYTYKNGQLEEDKVDIIVFSQGIQAEGLTHAEAMTALGEVTKANVESWIADVNVNDAVINDMI